MDHLNLPLRTSKYLRIVPTRTDFALYHTLFGGLCITDNNTIELVKCFRQATNVEDVFKNHKYTSDEIKSFIEFFNSRSLLVDPRTDEYSVIQNAIESRTAGLKQGKEIKIIQLIVTNRCNFHCKYCFIRSIYSYKERLQMQEEPENAMMNTGQAQKYIEEIIKIVRKSNTPTLMIQFFGGEPLMNWPVISSVLSHFKDGREYGVTILYSIVTNGSLINSEIVEMFSRYNITVLFSFDSPKGDDRVMANRKSCRQSVMRSLLLLKDAGIRMAFNSVMSKQTFEYLDFDLVDFACQYDVPEIGVILDLDPTFYTHWSSDEIAGKLLSLHRYGRKKGVIITGYWHQIFQQLVMFKRFEHVGFKTCSATGCQLSVEPNGTVFACKGSSGYFGNVLNMDSLLSSENWEKYSLRAFRNAPVCENCDIDNFCSGFCLGPLEKKYHDINVIEEDTCEVYKKLVKGLIHDVRKYEVDTLCML
jgi:uncharacterized protein